MKGFLNNSFSQITNNEYKTTRSEIVGILSPN